MKASITRPFRLSMRGLFALSFASSRGRSSFFSLGGGLGGSSGFSGSGGFFSLRDGLLSLRGGLGGSSGFGGSSLVGSLSHGGRGDGGSQFSWVWFSLADLVLGLVSALVAGPVAEPVSALLLALVELGVVLHKRRYGRDVVSILGIGGILIEARRETHVGGLREGVADTGLPRTTFIVDEDLNNVDFVDDDVDLLVDLVDEKVDAVIAEERLAGVLIQPRSVSDDCQ